MMKVRTQITVCVRRSGLPLSMVLNLIWLRIKIHTIKQVSQDICVNMSDDVSTVGCFCVWISAPWTESVFLLCYF